jgi:hypothetical protein
MPFVWQGIAAQPPGTPDLGMSPDVEAQRAAWDEAAWAQAQATGTFAAYTAYLRALPDGRYHTQAIDGWRRSSTMAGTGDRPAGCKTPDSFGEATRRLRSDAVYPSVAVSRNLGGVVIANMLIDRTGVPLGFEPLFVSEPVLLPAARRDALFTRYQPSIKHCTTTPLVVTPRIIIFYYADDAYESRANAPSAPTPLTVGRSTAGVLTEAYADRYSLPVRDRIVVYEVTHSARFPLQLTRDRSDEGENGRRPEPLADRRLIVVPKGETISIRVSAPDQPNTRKKFKGPYQLTVRQVWQSPSTP